VDFLSLESSSSALLNGDIDQILIPKVRETSKHERTAAQQRLGETWKRRENSKQKPTTTVSDMQL
jgi:hypothetical protein